MVLTLVEYGSLVDGKTCINCGRPLQSRVMVGDENSQGWDVEEFSEPHWLYVPCPSPEECGFENSLADLGITAGKREGTTA